MSKLNEENKFYVDASNSYAWALSECLPYHSFRIGDKIRLYEFVNTKDESVVCYFAEIDLNYPNGI